MFTNCKHVNTELIGEFYFFDEMKQALMRSYHFFGDRMSAYISECANAYFHRAKLDAFGIEFLNVIKDPFHMHISNQQNSEALRKIAKRI